MPAESIVGHFGVTAAIHTIERLRRVRFWRLKAIRPNAEIRVSFSALLRIPDGGRYVLVRNLHRPEIFGPFGGVYKFHDGCRPFLDSLLFRPQDVGPVHDMRNDLRGFLPRKNLGKILKWFREHSERESASDCLSRELNEEVREIRLNTSLTPPAIIQVRQVRTVEEGPEKVPGHSYMQFRIFEVYDVISNSVECINFLKKLIEMSETSSDLLLADSAAVVAGRCRDGRVVGHHAVYLVKRKRIRPDAAPFVGS